MPRTWTEEQKRKQAEKIRKWKPWEHSTGPKTAEGKERCRYNALKEGTYTAQWPAVRKALRLQKEFMGEVMVFHLASQMLSYKRAVKEAASKRAVKDSDY